MKYAQWFRTGRVRSADGTVVAYRAIGGGPPVIVIPGALAVARDFDGFARLLGARFSVHTIERRGRGESGDRPDAYSIDRECEDVAALQAATRATLVFGHSFGGLVALEHARRSNVYTKVAVYERASRPGPNGPRSRARSSRAAGSSTPSSPSLEARIRPPAGRRPGC